MTTANVGFAAAAPVAGALAPPDAPVAVTAATAAMPTPSPTLLHAVLDDTIRLLVKR
jgi:hypothetical protein